MESRKFNVWVVLNVAAQATYLVADLVAKGHDVGSLAASPQANGGQGHSALFAYKITGWWKKLPEGPQMAMVREIQAILEQRKAGYHAVIVVDVEEHSSTWASDKFFVLPPTAHQHIDDD